MRSLRRFEDATLDLAPRTIPPCEPVHTVDYTNNLITIIMTQTFTGPDFSLQLDYKDAVYRALNLVQDQ